MGDYARARMERAAQEFSDELTLKEQELTPRRTSLYPEVREQVREKIMAALNDTPGVTVVDSTDNHTGPLGGVHSAVSAVIKIGSDIVPFAVSVYSDVRIDRNVIALLEQSKRDKQINEQFEELLGE